MDTSTPAETRPNDKARAPWLTRNLLALSGVSLLQDAASELLYPILPIFLTVTLGAPVVVVGAVEGVAEGIAAAVKLVAGRVADRHRARPLVVLGYGLAAVGKAVIAVAGIWPLVLAGRGIDRVGKGIRGAPRDVLLVDGIAPEARGRAFGFHRSADTAGAVIGPLLGLAMYEAFHQRIRPVLFIAVMPAVLSVALVAAVRDRAPVPSPAATGPVDLPIAPDRLPPATRRVIGLLTAFSLVNFPDALLLLRAGKLGLGVTGVILAYVLYNLSYTVLSYPAGALSDRLNPALIFGGGLVCFAVAYLGLGLAGTTAWVWPLFLVYGGYTAATDGVGKAWISQLTPKSLQGRAQGTFQGATGGAVLVAGLWAGAAWQGTGRGPLLLSGTVALLVAAVLLTSSRRLTGASPSPAG